MTHKKFCYFSALLYLTSPFIAACHIKYSHIKQKYLHEILYNWPTLPFGTIIDGGQLHTSAPLSAGLIGKKVLWTPVVMCKLRTREISLANARY